MPDPVQLYQTAMFDREDRRQLRFLIVPARSFANDVRDAGAVADLVGIERRQTIDPLEPWALPFLLDGMSGQPFPDYPFLFELPWRDIRMRQRGPSSFAQHAAFAPVIPFEQSPVKGESLAGLMIKTGGVTAAVGIYLKTGDPVAALLVPGGGAVYFTALAPALRRLEVAVGRLVSVEIETEPRDDPPTPADDAS